MQVNVGIIFGSDETVPDYSLDDLALQFLAVVEGDPDTDICHVSVQRPPLSASVGAMPEVPPPPV